VAPVSYPTFWSVGTGAFFPRYSS